MLHQIVLAFMLCSVPLLNCQKSSIIQFKMKKPLQLCQRSAPAEQNKSVMYWMGCILDKYILFFSFLSYTRNDKFVLIRPQNIDINCNYSIIGQSLRGCALLNFIILQLRVLIPLFWMYKLLYKEFSVQQIIFLISYIFQILSPAFI